MILIQPCELKCSLTSLNVCPPTLRQIYQSWTTPSLKDSEKLLTPSEHSDHDTWRSVLSVSLPRPNVWLPALLQPALFFLSSLHLFSSLPLSWWWWNRKTKPSWYSGTSWSRTRAPAGERHTWTSCVTCIRRSASFSARRPLPPLRVSLCSPVWPPTTADPTHLVHHSSWKKESALSSSFF